MSASALQEVELLLVEDNPQDAELTLRALTQANVANRVQAVRDGAEALDFLFSTGAYAGRNGRPKVVLLDLKLPKVDGIEVLRRIRQDSRTRFLPVVILTSSKDERDVVAAYQLGVNSYIVKPVDFEKMVASVTELGLYWMLLNNTPAQR